MVRLCFITVNLLFGIAILVYGQSTVSDCHTGSDRNHGLDQMLCPNLLLKMEKVEEMLQSVVQEVKIIRNIQMYDKVKACPFGFEFLPEVDGCFKVIFESLSWSEAAEACKGVMPGVHLAAITNAAKQKAIEDYLKREFEKTESSVCANANLRYTSGKSAWIGGQRQNSTSCATPFVWKTVDSIEIPFGYSNWHPNEPNCDADNEHCVHMGSGINYMWNDLVCGRPLCALCEF